MVIDINNLSFERARREEANELLGIIHRCLRQVNSKDYGTEESERLIKEVFIYDKIERNILNTHFYVVKYNAEILGMGGVSRDLSKINQSFFISVFINPDYHGMGIGKKLIDFLEKDEWCLASDVIEIPASTTAHKFYNKLGYEYYTTPPVFNHGLTIMFKNISKKELIINE